MTSPRPLVNNPIGYTYLGPCRTLEEVVSSARNATVKHVCDVCMKDTRNPVTMDVTVPPGDGDPATIVNAEACTECFTSKLPSEIVRIVSGAGTFKV